MFASKKLYQKTSELLTSLIDLYGGNIYIDKSTLNLLNDISPKERIF